MRYHCTPISLLKKGCFHDVFPQLPMQPSTECMQTDTLHSDPILFFDGTCHKNHHKPTANLASTVIDAAGNHPLPQFASLAILPSPPPSEKQWDLYLSFLEERVLSSEREHDANAYVGVLLALGRNFIRNGMQKVEGGWRHSILGFNMAGALFNCS